MKILYLCTFYHRAMLFRQQMDALEKRGHFVRVFSSAEFGEGIAKKFLPLIDEKVKHVECWGKWDRILFFPRQWKIEKKLLKSYNVKDFDLLHSHLMLSSGYTALRLKRKYGVKYIVSVRETDLSGFIRIPLFKKMALKIMKQANGIIFLSYMHQKRLIAMYKNPSEKEMIIKKSSVIGNCVEKFWENNTYIARKTLQDENDIKILIVAKILPVKNIPIAAKAVENLNLRGYKATLTVVGEIQDEDEASKIRRYSCVNMLSFKTKEELLNIYRSNDIFLLPSKSETFGRVYVEAMTQALPIIYTKGQGFDGYYENGEVGYAVHCNEPNEIADRILDIVRNYARLSKRCLEASADFYEDVIMDELEKVYKKSVGCFVEEKNG